MGVKLLLKCQFFLIKICNVSHWLSVMISGCFWLPLVQLQSEVGYNYKLWGWKQSLQFINVPTIYNCRSEIFFNCRSENFSSIQLISYVIITDLNIINLIGRKSTCISYLYTSPVQRVKKILLPTICLMMLVTLMESQSYKSVKSELMPNQH